MKVARPVAPGPR